MYLPVQNLKRTKVSLLTTLCLILVDAEQLMQIRYANSTTPIRRSIVGETDEMIKMKEKKKLDDQKASELEKKERRQQMKKKRRPLLQDMTGDHENRSLTLA